MQRAFCFWNSLGFLRQRIVQESSCVLQSEDPDLGNRHEKTIEDAGLASFEFYCFRHTFATRAAQSGMDRFTLARLMGHSSPAVAARDYIDVTERHVAAGSGKFVENKTRNVAEGIAAAFPQASEAVQ